MSRQGDRSVKWGPNPEHERKEALRELLNQVSNALAYLDERGALDLFGALVIADKRAREAFGFEQA